MEKNKIETLSGSVENIVFHSEDTGFTVLEMNDGENLITVVGQTMGIASGEELRITGSYGSHPTYGLQFKAQMIERTVPATANAILKYLSTGAIRGVGPVLARRLVENYGDDTLTVIEKEPEKLSKVRGITPKKAQEINAEYNKLFGIRAVMTFLTKFSIDAAMSIKVWKRFGTHAPSEIEKDPYCLCMPDIGLKFEQADVIASTFDMDGASLPRLRGGVLYVLRHNRMNGHCCLPYDKLLNAAAGMLTIEAELLDTAIMALVEEEEIISETVEGTLFLYLAEMYQAETYVAGRIMMMLSLQNPQRSEVTEDLKELEEKLDIQYAQLQKKAILSVLNDNVVILTGGPGTGKTTTLNGMITVLESHGLKVGLAAPTGRAAKRMSELTGREARTIHRLLEVDFGEDDMGRPKFKRGAKNPLPYDAVVIDEMSMVDIEIFASLMQALRMGAKLIMVGDPDQLPSVGPGNVLRDLIDSDVITVIHLTEVFRQAAQSLIVTNAHAIVAGELPNLEKRDSDFFFMSKGDISSTVKTITDLCAQRLPKTYGYSPFWDIQVISPTRVGVIGTAELCSVLQGALNPAKSGKSEIRFGHTIFREGDKVMQVRNNYDIVYTKDSGEQGVGVYNGDIGVIDMLNKPTRSLHVRYDDRMAEYNFDMLQELELAYAVTVHKSQGSEFEAVIIPLMGSHSRLFYRNLLYTAVTRAKKLLIIVGQEKTVAEMVANNRRTLRFTNLGRFLQEGI